PRMLGGFIWEWADQGLRRTNADGLEFIAYGGDFGDMPNHGIFSIKGLVTSDRGIYPKYWEVRKVYQPVSIAALSTDLSALKVEIINRHHFLNLREFETRWSVSSDNETLESGVLDPIELAPGQTNHIEIPTRAITEHQSKARWLRVSLHT